MMNGVINTSSKNNFAVTRPPSPFVSRWLAVVLHHSFAFAPVLVFASLYLFSWRVAALIGHWPLPSIDDPKFVAPNDMICNVLYFSVFPLMMWSVAALLLFPLLTFHLRGAYPKAWTLALIAIFAVSWVVLRADPGSRLMWFAD